MEIRWTEKAVQNLDAIEMYISQDNPKAAVAVIARIFVAIERLKEYPALGRAGRVPGTRELIVASTQYIVPYRVHHQTIEILRIFHGAMKWPESFN